MSDRPSFLSMLCKICERRKRRRYCPGVTGDICAICCGNERERTIDCPLDCEYLREAHDHEPTPSIDLAQIPNRDVKFPSNYVETDDILLRVLMGVVHKASMEAPRPLDADLGEGLEAVIRTLRTRASGLYYESRPDNPIAAAISKSIQEGVETLQRLTTEKGAPLRDTELLHALVYIQHEALSRRNGRPRCRAFLEFLHRLFPDPKLAEPSSPLILT